MKKIKNKEIRSNMSMLSKNSDMYFPMLNITTKLSEEKENHMKIKRHRYQK